MKFSFLLCLLILCPITAQPQTKATTEDGRKVILNADGSWKYAESSPSVTLKIEAALVYVGGNVRPVARRPFALLAADPTPELMRLPRAGEHNLNGVQQLAQNCWKDSYPDAPAIIRNHTRYTFTTGFDGKAELRDIAPGKYWIFGQTPASDRCVMWIMEVDMTKDQSLTLDQLNAI